MLVLGLEREVDHHDGYADEGDHRERRIGNLQGQERAEPVEGGVM